MIYADIAAAFILCQSYFAGSSVMCDAIPGGRCHYEWTDPRCVNVESQYYAPGGPGDVARNAERYDHARAKQELDILLSH
jgi:hypothetical protein